jgi:hypothetical protein
MKGAGFGFKNLARKRGAYPPSKQHATRLSTQLLVIDKPPTHLLQ